MNNKKTQFYLTPKKIQKQTSKGVKKYEKLNFVEQFGMYMGVAQLLEISLKNMLVTRYSYDLEKLKRWTLGRIAKELEINILRQDFIQLLDGVVEYRNYIAHELLSNQILYKSLYKNLTPKNHYDKELRRLHKAIYELEQLIFLFRWTEENDAWG